MDIEIGSPLRPWRQKAVAEFLAREALDYDPAIPFTVNLLDDDKIVGTGSLDGNICKCIAIDPAYQGEGLTATIITQLRQEAFRRGLRHLFLYTKPRNRMLFEPLFFYCFFGILLGARLGHCIFYEPAYYFHDFPRFLEMWLPIRFTPSGVRLIGYQGLASHGGTLGLMIALCLYVRKYKVPLWTVLDDIAIATPITFKLGKKNMAPMAITKYTIAASGHTMSNKPIAIALTQRIIP